MFDHYEWFKNEVYRLTQIDLNYYKEKQMRRRIDTLAKKNGADSYETYIDMISTDKAKFKQFINFITINVSEFYRNPDQWSFLDREVIPEILKNNTGTIKIWSAACSTGDEPYSLAMAFSKHVPLSRIKILAYETYIDMISTDKAKFKQFINFITINVSEFYRNPDQWSFLDREVIPEILKNNTGTIKIWSAACSTGDEPYSLAMAFSKHVPLSRIKILATDIDDQVIASAKAGLYSAKSVENVPADLKKKYFTQVEGSYKISDDIKRCVTFKEHNLLKDSYPKDYDLILCRNVVIYFTDDAKDMIYKNFFNTLKSKGILFIGSTEQITTYRELGFERLSSFYFRKP